MSVYAAVSTALLAATQLLASPPRQVEVLFAEYLSAEYVLIPADRPEAAETSNGVVEEQLLGNARNWTHVPVSRRDLFLVEDEVAGPVKKAIILKQSRHVTEVFKADVNVNGECFANVERISPAERHDDAVHFPYARTGDIENELDFLCRSSGFYRFRHAALSEPADRSSEYVGQREDIFKLVLDASSAYSLRLSPSYNLIPEGSIAYMPLCHGVLAKVTLSEGSRVKPSFYVLLTKIEVEAMSRRRSFVRSLTPKHRRSPRVMSVYHNMDCTPDDFTDNKITIHNFQEWDVKRR
ncbi:hypothetical protein FOZ61_004061 [Perkinsus olseni]|uniref:Uncharacterized protein n=1 Tax=Perkinsus olseni TaxID=32597 RepID=A0A7J6LMY5_PEROL|nr:hypothetical protein FOZ61_004061 [Perkinsus olseni]KAF4665149.1 hypothetical protein FOL46_003854 [Perkinsus olseni]